MATRKNEPLTLSEKTEISIPLRNLAALIVVTAMFVGQYFIMDGRLDQLEKDRDYMINSQKSFEEFESVVNPLISESSVRFEYIDKELKEIKELLKSTK